MTEHKPHVIIEDIKTAFVVVALVLSGITFLSCFPVGAAPTTNAATSVNGTGATFNGVGDIAADYWFEYSGTADGFTMATETNVSAGAGGSYKQPMYGLPFAAGHTYYYRLCRDGSCGATQSFTLAAITAVPTSTYTEQYFTPFIQAKWNFTYLAYIVPSPYVAAFGGLIWGIFWGAILMAFWVRQEDVTIPAFTYLLLFSILSLGNYLPSQFVTVSQVLAAICLGAILYTLFRGRKHG